MRRLLVFALLWTLGPVTPALSQDRTPPARLHLPDEYEEWAAVRAQVLALIARVFAEHPELKAHLAELEEAKLAEMTSIDPRTTARLVRMEELEAAYDGAQARGDVAGLESMFDEGREIRRALEATEAEAWAQPNLARRYEAFHNEFVARVTEIDPNAVRLFARDDALVSTIWTTAMTAR